MIDPENDEEPPVFPGDIPDLSPEDERALDAAEAARNE
jgi:hypothetical protein